MNYSYGRLLEDFTATTALVLDELRKEGFRNSEKISHIWYLDKLSIAIEFNATTSTILFRAMKEPGADYCADLITRLDLPSYSYSMRMCTKEFPLLKPIYSGRTDCLQRECEQLTGRITLELLPQEHMSIRDNDKDVSLAVFHSSFGLETFSPDLQAEYGIVVRANTNPIIMLRIALYLAYVHQARRNMTKACRPSFS